PAFTRALASIVRMSMKYRAEDRKPVIAPSAESTRPSIIIIARSSILAAPEGRGEIVQRYIASTSSPTVLCCSGLKPERKVDGAMIARSATAVTIKMLNVFVKRLLVIFMDVTTLDKS